MASRKKTLLYWALTLVFTLGIIEGLLHLATLTVPVASALMAPHRVADQRLGWRFNSGYPDIDEWGFRNRQVPHQVDLVALGDSQTYGYGVELAQAWPQQLARLSGLDSYNFACSGYGPGHSLLLWEEALSLKPKHIIVALYAGNDAFDSFNLLYNGGQLTHLGVSR